MLIELLRRGAEVGYVGTEEGFEVDFFACYVEEEEEELIQVCVDLDDNATREREARALFSAGRERPRTKARMRKLVSRWIIAASADGTDPIPAAGDHHVR